MVTVTPKRGGVTFLADYRREHGVHSFEMQDGSPVTAVSAESWQQLAEQLPTIPDHGYVMTPELITSAHMELDEIHGSRDVIQGRTELVLAESQHRPNATIALGTTAYTHLGLTNRLSFVRGGEIIGAIDKNFLTDDEKPVFARGPQEGRRWSDNPNAQFAICSEIIRVALNRGREQGDLSMRNRSNALARATISLLVSSCWSVPMSKNQNMSLLPDEERYRGQLEDIIGLVFGAYPKLQDIIVTDRTPEGSTVRPCNSHFQRIPADQSQ